MYRAPTAGGQYHWVFMLAPKPAKKFLSYITGARKVFSLYPKKSTDWERLAHCPRVAVSGRIRWLSLWFTNTRSPHPQLPAICAPTMAWDVVVLGYYLGHCIRQYRRQYAASEDRRGHIHATCSWIPRHSYCVVIYGPSQYGVGSVYTIPQRRKLEYARSIIHDWAARDVFLICGYASQLRDFLTKPASMSQQSLLIWASIYRCRCCGPCKTRHRPLCGSS